MAEDNWLSGQWYRTDYIPSGFNWQSYIAANPDLPNAGIDTQVEAERHFATYGRNENRSGVYGSPSPSPAIQAPDAMYPGMTNDPLWESIISRHWNRHIGEAGIGWDTGRTSDAERAGQLRAMQQEYLQARQAQPSYTPPTEVSKSYIGKGFSALGDLADRTGSLQEMAATASGARMLLAQPEKVSADYIRQNFPSLGQFPEQTLAAMGQDWRNAYGQMIGLLEPVNIPQGYTKAVVRREGGKPFVSFGGPTEMFAEAAPYIVYSPEYGLIAPQAGIRPAEKSRGLLDIIGSIAPGIALSAILGPAGMGLSLPAAGAVTGGISSLLNDQNILKGAITGGVLGGVGQVVAPEVAQVLKDVNITGPAAEAIKAAAVSAAKAAVVGGDPLQAALTAAAGAGVGSAVGGLDVVKEADPALAKAIAAAAAGAAKAVASGGDPLTAALTSAVGAGASGALQFPKEGEPAPQSTEPSGEATTTEDILTQLGRQEAEQQDLQTVLAQAGIAPPTEIAEQQGLLPGDYKQETTADELRRLAESALGAVIPSAQATGKDRLVLTQPEAVEGAATRDYKSFFDVMSSADPQSAYAGLSAEEKASVDRAGQEFQASSEERQADLLGAYKTGQFATIETPSESWIDRGMLAAEQPTSIQDILGALEQQQTQQQAMQQALTGYAKPEERQQNILGALTQQKVDADAAIRALEQATGQKISAGDADILDRLAQQGASQAEMESALRGEISGLGKTFDQRLADILAQQEEEQAGMRTALQGYDQRILDLMAQGESEQEAMRQALAESQAATQQQIAGVQTGVGQQIGGLGKIISDLTKQFGATTQGLQQQVQQTQQQAGFGNLLGLLGMMQQKPSSPPPIQLVGEIKPFEFSTDLLAGIYSPNKMGSIGANEELLKLARG